MRKGKKPARWPADDKQWVDPERCFGPKPTEAQLEALRAAGVRTLVHLPRPGESARTEQIRVRNAELGYVMVPMAERGFTPEAAHALIEVLNQRQNGSHFVYDEGNGRMAGAFTLLFKAVPNFWSYDRYAQEATRRGIALEELPGFVPCAQDYLSRFVRGRR